MSRKKQESLVIDDAPMPPEAPEPGRALRMTKTHIVTLIVLGGIVVSALAGVYNEKQSVVRVAAGGVEINARFTTRFRFQQTDIVSVMLRNTTSAMIDTVRVSVDTAYMAGFSEVSMVPEPTYPFVADMLRLPPGESREVRVEARGDRFGRHEGDLLISVRGDTARVRLSTLVLP